MTDNETLPSPRPYPALDFLVRHGDWIAIVVAVAAALAGIAASVNGLSFVYGVAGLGVAAFLYLIMRSYVELVRVIVDMLLPK